MKLPTSSNPGSETLLKRWLGLVYGVGFRDPQPVPAQRMLSEHPGLVDGDAALACVIGDEATIRKTLSGDPEWLTRPSAVLNMTPLIVVTHSGLLRQEAFAAPLMRCAKLLLDHGADPNQTWIDPSFPSSPLTPLYGAAGRNHHAGMTKLLLEHGANPNDNESLYHSVESDDLTCTRLLLEAGATVDGTNAIGHVLDYDRIEGLRLLLAYGGDPGKPGASEFPIFHAIRRGRSVEHMRLLLEAGADPASRNSEGMTPHRFALYYGQPEVAAMLGSETDSGKISKEEQFVGACACGNRAAAFQQMESDPDILRLLSHKDLHQLPALAAQKNLRGVKLMVAVGWPIDVKGGDWSASALNLAVFNGHVEMTDFLLRHGASWEERHGFGDNVMGTLSYASRAADRDTHSGDWLGCAKALIAHGMPVPSLEYEFAEEVSGYFEALRRS